MYPHVPPSDPDADPIVPDIRRPTDPSGKRSPLLAVSALVLVATLCGSCATAVGTVAGPVTGPLTTWRHSHNTHTLGHVLIFPMAVAVGPFLGLVQGVRCDLGFARNGAYGEDGFPPFSLVLDPASTEYSQQYPDREQYPRYPEDARNPRHAR